MVGSPPSKSRTHRWHRVVEHYTPSGALGRLILAACTGTVSFSGFLVAAAVINTVSALWFLVAPLAAGFSIATALLTLVTLWPVYLSLIGNVESPESYMNKGRTTARPVEASAASFGATPEREPADDAIDEIKRQYAEGDITEEELDERVENLLRVDEVRSRANRRKRQKQRN